MSLGLVGIVAVGLLIAVGVLVVLVAISLRSGRASADAAAERDPWEESLLADTTPPPSVPGYASAAYPPLGTYSEAAAPDVLDRDALVGRDRTFDPHGWDDRPDGYEGTDMGLVGDDKG